MTPTTGTRYCRARRRRGVVPGGALTVRHGRGGLLLTRAAAVAGPISPRRSWRGAAASAVAAGLALAAVTLLLSGAYLRPIPSKGPCPVRTSADAYAGGRHLLLRAEPARSGTVLLHLCADRAIGRVRSWTVVAGPGERSAAQVVGPGVALAAVPPTTNQHSAITVVVRPETGPPLIFTARLARTR